MALTVPAIVGQSFTISANPEDSANGPAQITPGSIVWSNGNPSCMQITPSSDTLSCNVKCIAPGTNNIVISDPTDNAGAQAAVQVVIAPGKLDHFAPTATTPA